VEFIVPYFMYVKCDDDVQGDGKLQDGMSLIFRDESTGVIEMNDKSERIYKVKVD